MPLINLEFCFNCYSTEYNSRREAAAAIRSIPWHQGLTYTGGAARCVCNELLKQDCGMDPLATCIAVVFITDGKSNEPHLKVFDEVKCLHNHLNRVSTYAVGINNFYRPEIQCITSSSNLMSVRRLSRVWGWYHWPPHCPEWSVQVHLHWSQSWSQVGVCC